jgi:CBS domain-containing protein
MINPTLSQVPLSAIQRVSAGATLREVAATMADHRVSSVLVGNESLIVTEHDLAGALAAGIDPVSPVGQLSSTRPVWATTDSTLLDAVDLMVTNGIRHLIVRSPAGEVHAVLPLETATEILLGKPPPGHQPTPVHAKEATSQSAPSSIKTIAVGFDGSADAVHALRWALSFARSTRASVVAVHAVGLLEPHGDQRTADELARQVDEIVDGDPIGSSVPFVLLDGTPSSVLARASGPPLGADLLVVGSRGAGSHSGSLLGSTSLTLTERSEVPVVIVPHPPGSSP